MKIEIAKLGRMSQTGSSLMTLYQDKHTPILDLLVRESVQNCLDAGNNISEKAEYKKFVEVSFLTGGFCPRELNEILEGSTEALNERFPQLNAKFLAVKDKYTIGLTGPLRMSDVKDYKYGNLLKLVYDICKPQETAGAGGSWGIGKTIYFRIGIGLVAYYSRIWNDDIQDFESRFAVSIVEDEHSQDAIIPKDSNTSNTGIAWWGNKVTDAETEPVTNEEEINRYLNIFGIEPYSEKETGTIVIVPYIDEARLLCHNRTDDEDSKENGGNRIIPTWMHSIDEYLTIAVQRWYFPRLNNKDYHYGRYLKLYVNNKLIRRSDMQPIFLCWQNLYNSAHLGKKVFNEDDDIDDFDIQVERIGIRKYLSESCSGHVAYSCIGRETLGIRDSDSKYSPYMYIDIDTHEGELNKPLMAFCRMPGLIVNYKGNDDWLNKVPSTDKDKYLIAIFVLNSNNTLDGGVQTLEEYVRKSELADHHSWEDYNTGHGKRPDIITNIKKNTSHKLAKAFEKKEDNNSVKVDSGWGKVMADLILPKEGFGTRSSRKPRGESRLEYESHKSISIALSEEDTSYFENSMDFTYYIRSIRKLKDFNLNLFIGSEGSKQISAISWENDGLRLPFEIDSILVRLEKIDGKEQALLWRIYSSDDNIFDSLLTLKLNKTSNGTAYGINVSLNTEHTFQMSITFTIKIIDKTVKPILKPE